MDILVERSEDYLQHHGVKGMKWGKWNAETAARYNGTSRYTKPNPFGFHSATNAVDDSYNRAQAIVDARDQASHLIYDLKNVNKVRNAAMSVINELSVSKTERTKRKIKRHVDTKISQVESWFAKHSK